MKISTKGRYALRLMVDIAQHVDDGPVSLRDAARRQQLSDKYLEQIVTALARAGLVRSVRGRGAATCSPGSRKSILWATSSVRWRAIWPRWSAPPTAATASTAATV